MPDVHFNGSHLEERETVDGDTAYVRRGSEFFALEFLGDEPPLSIDGSRATPTKLTRYVPNGRAMAECSIDGYVKPCDTVVDLDQFLGAHDY